LLGEFVIVVAGQTVPAAPGDAEVIRVYELLAAELPPARAVALCAKISGRSRNTVYALTRR
jgi:16S rRNA C1402 (ribose-2'-O) methylase RsmI